jgi:hypothetical protein
MNFLSLGSVLVFELNLNSNKYPERIMFKTLTEGDPPVSGCGRARGFHLNLTRGTRWSAPNLSEAVSCRWILIQRPEASATAATRNWRRRGSGDGEADRALTSRVLGDVRTVRRDGGGSGKILGRSLLAGEVRCDGGELLLLRGSAPTPASNRRRSWARGRGKKGAGE